MPTVDQNKTLWDGKYSWADRGDEWSASWGGSAMQWYGSILPRIHRHLPAKQILEIACGYGRWTQYLKNSCKRLTAIDLAAECVSACRERFSDCNHIDFHVNDGTSLAMIPDASIDFVFSFDSLVHVNDVVMGSYLSQLPRVLTNDGVAFLHHSNLGEYARLFATLRRIPRLEKLLTRLEVLDHHRHWRDPGVDARTVSTLANKHGLACISQEVVRWDTRRLYIDCMSTIVKSGSPLAKPRPAWRNAHFMGEARYLSQIGRMYEKAQLNQAEPSGDVTGCPLKAESNRGGTRRSAD